MNDGLLSLLGSLSACGLFGSFLACSFLGGFLACSFFGGTFLGCFLLSLLLGGSYFLVALLLGCSFGLGLFFLSCSFGLGLLSCCVVLLLCACLVVAWLWHISGVGTIAPAAVAGSAFVAVIIATGVAIAIIAAAIAAAIIVVITAATAATAARRPAAAHRGGGLIVAAATLLLDFKNLANAHIVGVEVVYPLEVVLVNSKSVGNVSQIFTVGHSVIGDTFLSVFINVVFVAHDAPDVARLNFLAACKLALVILGNLVLGHAVTLNLTAGQGERVVVDVARNDSSDGRNIVLVIERLRIGKLTILRIEEFKLIKVDAQYFRYLMQAHALGHSCRAS